MNSSEIPPTKTTISATLGKRGTTNTMAKSLKKNLPADSQQSITTGIFVRSLALARLAFNTSGELWGFKTPATPTSTLSPEKQAELQARLEDQAREITRELGMLKGSVMKVGQMLAMYGEHFLPNQVNQILKALQADSPPLDWATMKPFVEAELKGKEAEIEIEPTALAAASIGQVHSARVKKTGAVIALKIQYPGVDKAISSDLKALKTIAMFAPGVPKGPRTTEMISEIEDMLWREIDYTREADAAEKFANLLGEDRRFLIPKVFREWCTPKVLATQMICGHRIDSDVLRALSHDRRNALADALLDLYLNELFNFGCVQTDAHMGNYRIRLKGEIDCDGQLIDRDHIVLLDFGAVRDLNPDFVSRYRRLIKASLEQDRNEVDQAALNLGFLKPCDPPEVMSAFYGFCRLVIEPFDPAGASEEGQKFFDKDGNYDWRGNTLPTRLSHQLTEIIRAREFRAPPREAIFLDRKSSGLYILLGALGARTNSGSKLKLALSQTS